MLRNYATFCALAERYGCGLARLAGRPAASIRFRPSRALHVTRVPGTASGSTSGCSTSSIVSWHARRRRCPSCTICRSDSTLTAPMPGPSRTCWPRASASARRQTSSTREARTGGCRRSSPTSSAGRDTSRSSRRFAPACDTPEVCASITSWACSGCSGYRPDMEPAAGAYVRSPAERAAGDRRARKSAGTRRHRRRGSGHGGGRRRARRWRRGGFCPTG